MKVLRLLPLLLLLACQQPRALRIAVAANLSLPLQELAAAYEAQTGLPVEVITASSGVLTAQIRQGAPFDLFLSANMKYPQALAAEGLTSGTPEVLAYGQLIAWSRDSLPGNDLMAYIRDLPAGGRVAIANPELAPYGRAALSWLEQEGLDAALSSRLVFGENIGQVNRYIYARAVDLAFTAVSARTAPELQSLGLWHPLPAAAGGGIPHGICRLRAAQPGSEALEAFLQSEAARAVLARYGYGLPATE
ncbi:MAG: molybdate ABC transporter substrate-binding protein [Bacteroidetes bacterium]|nr:MAG: molybdate ABC transporter substrate-binding protein [Bacteroidota bacterium]